MTFALDARYVRERPSGIGAYVAALLARLPALAPRDRFVFWTHRLAPPVQPASHVVRTVVPVEPNSLWTILNPGRYVDIRGLDLFHGPHNILPRSMTCATVVTVQDLMALERPHLLFRGARGLVKRAYYPAAVRAALARATRLIVSTVAMADRVRAIRPDARSRLAVIPLAADERFAPPQDRGHAAARAAALIGSPDPYMLVVGQGAPHKRHEDAIRAFAAVPRPWRLVLLQRQGTAAAVDDTVRRLSLADRVVRLPAIGEGDVVALMQAAGALVHPSSYEGFGLPVLEAMACGCPVVAADLDVVREVARGAVTLVPVGDVLALGRALAALAESPALGDDLAGRGLERARAFSWDRCARETLAVYRDALR